MLESFLMSIAAGALLEAIVLKKQQCDEEKRREIEDALRMERLDEKFETATNEALGYFVGALSDDVREGFLRCFGDELVQAEIIKFFLAGGDMASDGINDALAQCLERHSAHEDCKRLAPELLEAFMSALARVVAEEPQLRFLREIEDHRRLAAKVDALAADTDEFHTTFIRLREREVNALREMVTDLGEMKVDQRRLIDIVTERLPEPPPEPDYRRGLRAYRKFVVERHGRVSLWSVKADRPMTGDLERVYISLKTQGEREPDAGEEEPEQMEEALLRDRDAEERSPGAVRITEALKEHKKLVVVGAPGSGKTTLLQYLALTYARGRAAERLGLEEILVPIFVPLRDSNKHLDGLRARHDLVVVGPKHLLEFTSAYLRTLGPDLDLPDDFFDRAVSQGKSVILLDGIDEVPSPDERGRVSQAVASFVKAYPENRYVITSRPHGYEGAARQRLQQWCQDCTVEDFSGYDIEQFVKCWYETVMVSDLGDTSQAHRQAKDRARDLVAAIMGKERDQIRRLARSPLLLSVLAAVHYRHVRLPHRRVEVYDECVEFLLGYWDEIKDPDSEAAWELSVLEGRDRSWKRKFIAPVALDFHVRGVRSSSWHDFKPQLIKKLGRPDDPTVEERAEKMLRVIQERSGLLQEGSPGEYSFSHFTFQEYLTAWLLGEGLDPFAGMADRIAEPWWEEVVRLEAAHLSLRGEEKTTYFVDQILAASPKSTPAYCRNLALAARCLIDCTEEHVEWELWDKVTQELVEMLGGSELDVDLSIRIDAGNALGQMGDPRLGEMVTIPAGEFTMGTPESDVEQIVRDCDVSEESVRREVPQRKVHVGEFEIDRYPVTNAQYKEFVDAAKHRAPRRWEGDAYPPEAANHPVLSVSWADANAYTEWAGKRLPTEAEWEKAARGTDGRVWPWGNEWAEDACNSKEAEGTRATSVGILPRGGSPYGVEDMAGNVYEWCADRFAEQRPDGKAKPKRPESGDRRVIKGGGYGSSRGFVRCSYRYWLLPVSRSNLIGFRCAR